MKIQTKILGLLALIGFTSISMAGTSKTERIPQISNNKVQVWKTTIYPSSKQILKMHRHDHDRVVIALTDGQLKITNDKSQTHYLKLQKGHSYYLAKDLQNEMHTDENTSQHPVEVIVVELND